MRLQLLTITCFLCFYSRSNSAMDDWYDKCIQGHDSCEILAFKEMVKIYRPSREEEKIVEFIKNIFDKAKVQVWKNHAELRFVRDKMGNLVISVPATGVFTSNKKTPIALQAHLDMVLDKKGATPGEDLRPFFKDGVELEEKDGWLQSINNEKSIGADDTVGVAIALRYLLDINLAHPPLELVFTVQEEIGLVGAFGLEIPLVARRMINLDGMTAQAVTIGAQGSSKNLISGNFKYTHIPENSHILKISISNLQGGHSGIVIHRSRANAIKVMAQVLTHFPQKMKELMLIEFVAGNADVLNKIPNGVSATIGLSGPKPQINLIRKSIITELSGYRDEHSDKFKIDIEGVSSSHLHALPTEVSRDLLIRIGKAPHGVISTDSRFPERVNTSTNLAAISLTSPPIREDLNTIPDSSIIIGFMTRSFSSIKEIERVVNDTKKNLGELWSAFLRFKHQVTGIPYEPWIAPNTSNLLKLAMQDPYLKNKIYFSAGIEASAFMKKYPNMDIISLGPDIANQHTANEKVRTKSITEISKVIQKLLIRIN